MWLHVYLLITACTNTGPALPYPVYTQEVQMQNLTLSVDEKLIEEGRRYAKAHHTSLNALVRDLLAKTVQEDRTHWIAECTNKMDAANGRSRGKKWKREDLYDV